MKADEGCGDLDQDRRIDDRMDRNIEARVELSDRLAIPCRVKDLSATGFRIQIAEGHYLPDEFDLLVPVIEGTFQRYRVKLVWRKADMIGGEFVSPHSQ